MILLSNIERLIEETKNKTKVLDVGGWYRPFNLATHVIDLAPYETRRKHKPLDGTNKERFTKDTWTQHDICLGDWPYKDKEFDFVICSHILEDIRDPLITCKELIRVSKAGYIEVPSRTREIYCKKKLPFKINSTPEIGFEQHRWFCEIGNNHIKFIAKDGKIFENRDTWISRREAGRKLTEHESGICLWWDDSFTYEEVFDNDIESMKAFKQTALKAIKEN